MSLSKKANAQRDEDSFREDEGRERRMYRRGYQENTEESTNI